MDRDSIRAMVIAHASELSGVSARFIDDTTTLDQLGFDSLACVCLVVAIEDSTGVEISCGDRIIIETVGDAIKLASGHALRIAA